MNMQSETKCERCGRDQDLYPMVRDGDEWAELLNPGEVEAEVTWCCYRCCDELEGI
jgi:hypothetical protein